MNQLTRQNPRWLHSDIFGASDPRFLWPVSRLHQEMNRLFTDAFRGLEPQGEGEADFTFSPVVDVEQEDDKYEISVELPGVKMNDIDIEMKEDMLVIAGSKERKRTTGQGEQQRSERVYGTFQRIFRLPEDAVEDGIDARFSDGVLTVSIPRQESRSRIESRRIEIQDASRQREGDGSRDKGRLQQEDQPQQQGAQQHKAS
ncbi:MAG: Hsp20/alpha crystallin family protein [Woeseia sp.]